MSLKRKLETAVQSLLDTDLSPIGTFYSYLSAAETDRQLPAVVIAAGGGIETPHNSGNFTLPLTVTIMSQANLAADTVAHDNLVDRVEDDFKNNDFHTRLSAAVADFTVLGITDVTINESAHEDRHFVDSISAEFYCCEMDG